MEKLLLVFCLVYGDRSCFGVVWCAGTAPSFLYWSWIQVFVVSAQLLCHFCSDNVFSSLLVWCDVRHPGAGSTVLKLERRVF